MVMYILLPVELTSQRLTPLTNSTTKVFEEHWTGAACEEILVPAHEARAFSTKIAQQHTDMSQPNASAIHAAKLQAHVASLEEQIANLTRRENCQRPYRWLLQ